MFFSESEMVSHCRKENLLKWWNQCGKIINITVELRSGELAFATMFISLTCIFERGGIMAENKMAFDFQAYVSRYSDIIQKVIKDPAEFYRSMSRTGGFADPLTFMIAVAVLAGLVRAVLGVFGIGFAGSFLYALSSIILVPFFTTIFAFIVAGILFLIWNAMGSQQSFEVSFRCIAYASAIAPVTAVLDVIPYLGPVIGIAWMAYILVNASVEVHTIQPRRAWIVFGAIGLILIFASISSQIAARRIAGSFSSVNQNMMQKK